MPHVCPWWGGYFIDNPLRRLFHNPEKIVGPYVQPGMTVMDVGYPTIRYSGETQVQTKNSRRKKK